MLMVAAVPKRMTKDIRIPLQFDPSYFELDVGFLKGTLANDENNQLTLHEEVLHQFENTNCSPDQLTKAYGQEYAQFADFTFCYQFDDVDYDLDGAIVSSLSGTAFYLQMKKCHENSSVTCKEDQEIMDYIDNFDMKLTEFEIRNKNYVDTQHIQQLRRD